MSHQRNLVAQNPKGEFINLKVGYDGHIDNMKTAFGETTTAQLTPVLQEIFPYTINTRVWTKTETKASVSFLDNMAELKTQANATADAELVSKRRIKYRTGTGVLARFTALWTTDDTKAYYSFIGIGNDLNDGFYFYKNHEGMNIAHCKRNDVEYIDQKDWDDPCDGTSAMPDLEWSVGNVFQIQFQYLGFGAIKFSIENPETGEFQLVHMIKYANSNDEVSLGNTTLPFTAVMRNDAKTGIQILKTASASLFIEGLNTINTSITNSIEGAEVAHTTERPILSIRNKAKYDSAGANLDNYSLVYPSLISISNEDSKTNVVRMVVNGTLTGAVYADVDTKYSIVDTDTTATAIANGTTIFKIYVNANSTQQINLRNYDIYLSPSDVLTFTQKSVSTTNNGGNVNIIANFIEDW